MIKMIIWYSQIDKMEHNSTKCHRFVSNVQCPKTPIKNLIDNISWSKEMTNNPNKAVIQMVSKFWSVFF